VSGTTTANRALFVATIFTGSFLLFLVQPLVARMALPRLGGAPNVWNSAMLVYQALLLAGYGYAHRLSKMTVRRQAQLHIALLAVAAISLPIALADLPPPVPGMEVLWVPALLALTIGPVFFLVSAQAPLIQRWYAADPAAGAPWALYAASNLGSFSGLIAYPLLAEPLLPSGAQSWGWSIGYGLLVLLVIATARSRWNAPRPAPVAAAGPGETIGARRIALWLLLSAVPSGLMLSTTTHLTTDLFAMPLLWVIPLGLYLLSFTAAFSDNRTLVNAVSQAAPLFVLLAGGYAAASSHSATLGPVIGSVALLFIVCVALHGRLYDARPDPAQLTLFYFVMSAGGALGGLFTALVAPLVFDWAWEHPLLVLAAAALLPRSSLLDWRRMPGIDPAPARIATAMLFAVALALCWFLYETTTTEPEPTIKQYLLTVGIVGLGCMLASSRWLLPLLLAALMYAQGGWDTVNTSLADKRSRSYFGVYTVRDYPETRMRTLAHGTTLHGKQSRDPVLKRMPLTYYGPGSGAGIALANAARLFGPGARIGVVGLGTGTLACYHQRGQRWRFFEIDPAVLKYSRNGTFTYVADCAPDAEVVIGDARLELAKLPAGSFDLIAVDAFSSDAIPLHLLTSEAIGVYVDRLSPKGVLLVHISNRYIDLEPVLAAAAKQRGLAAAARDDVPEGDAAQLFTPSTWIAITRNPEQIAALGTAAPAFAWTPLDPPAARAWSDDHASILPYIRWRNLIGN
jgi:SAM-dependent methyltransferase